MKKLFLDFDLTITCYDLNGESFKAGANEFLKYCTDKYEVYWVSTADYDYIKEYCFGNIDMDIFGKIQYCEIEREMKVEYILNVEY